MGGIRPSFPVSLFPDAEGFQKKQDSIIIREELKHFRLPGYCFCPCRNCGPAQVLSGPSINIYVRPGPLFPRIRIIPEKNVFSCRIRSKYPRGSETQQHGGVVRRLILRMGMDYRGNQYGRARSADRMIISLFRQAKNILCSGGKRGWLTACRTAPFSSSEQYCFKKMFKVFYRSVEPFILRIERRDGNIQNL